MGDDRKKPVGGEEPARSYEALDTLSIAALDVDARIFRTVWHTITRPVEVMWAGCKADYRVYLSPVRVFLALFSLQVIVGSIVHYPTAPSLSALVEGMPPEQVTAWLDGRDPQAVNDDFAPYMAILMWPLMLVSSLPFLLALKLMRWRLSIWAHVTAYLVSTNASTILQAVLMPLALINPVLVVAALPLALIFFVVQITRLMARFYAKGVWDLAWKTGVIVLLLPVTILIMMVGAFSVASWLLHTFQGLSLFELYIPQTE